MPGIFARIISGEVPCYKVAEDDNYLAFLDINPLKKGHTLIIPKQEIDYIFDINDDLLAGMTVFAKKVAIAIERVIPCIRVGVVVLGLEVPHAHIHLIPLDLESDINFSNPRVSLTTEEFKDLAERVGAKVEK